MGEQILRNCGLFAWPQLGLSLLTAGVLIGYLIATARREIPSGSCPWTRTLEPLAGISVTLGLLGSVVGFIGAFGGFCDGLDVQRLTAGLSVAYWTTALGIITSLAACGGAYLLGILNR